MNNNKINVLINLEGINVNYIIYDILEKLLSNKLIEKNLSKLTNKPLKEA